MADDLYYGDAAQNKRLFAATAFVTAPVAYSTAAGTGGPLLWNASSTHVGRIVAVGWGLTTASTAAASLGITGGTGQTSAPSSTTAIDSITNCYIGGPAPNIKSFRVGTVSNAGAFFIPIGQVNTGALTTTTGAWDNWIALSRMIVIPPNGGWASIAANVVMSTAVLQVCVVWEEIPLPLGGS